MGCGPIRAGPIDPDFIRAANFMARPSKIAGQFGPAHRACPIFPTLVNILISDQSSSARGAGIEAAEEKKRRSEGEKGARRSEQQRRRQDEEENGGKSPSRQLISANCRRSERRHLN